MPRRGYSNVAYPIYLVGTLDGSSTTNTITVSTDPAGSPASPPGWPSTYPYFAVIDPDTPSEEIVSVTGGSGATLTITRGGALGAVAHGTATKSHTSGAVVVHAATAADYDEANAHVNATNGVHGLASGSAVVGTTDAQTLSNKTLAATTALSGGGTVVSTTAVQTLTNKTLTSPSITGSGSIAASTVTATGAIVGSNIPSGLDLSSAGALLTYTPTITGSGSNPTLGTGATAEGWYATLGKLVHVNVRIVLGTSPTPGTGFYSISLPIAVHPAVNQAAALSGVLFSQGTTTSRVPVVGALAASAISRIAIPAYTAANTYGQTWAATSAFAIGSGGTPALVAGDAIVFTGTYFRA